MTLANWLANRWIVEHRADKGEIRDLLSVVDRDLGDAAVIRVSADWRLNIAYNAVLQLASLALAAEGYRAARERAHERTIQSLEYTIGADRKLVDTIDAVRRKRNVSSYDRAGSASGKEAAEMLQLATNLRATVLAWLRRTHPEVLPED